MSGNLKVVGKRFLERQIIIWSFLRTYKAKIKIVPPATFKKPLCSMALIQVSQISFENEVFKWQHFYNKIVNKQDIITDMGLIFGQLIMHDKMKLV